MTSLKRFVLGLCLILWAGVVGWAAVTFFLSTLTPPEIEKIIPFKFWDKLGHFSLLGAGALVLAPALRVSTDWSWRRIVLASAISLYGATDEWHQQFTPGRSAKDGGDWTADTLGGIAGAAVAWLVIAHSRGLRKLLLIQPRSAG